MAYRGKKTYRRGATKKRYTRRKAPTWRSYAGKALTLAGTAGLKMLKKKLGLNTENKNYDQTWSQSFTGVASSLIFPFGGITQGTTNNTRVGNSIRVTHMTLKGRIQSNTSDNNVVRCRILAVLQHKVPVAGTTLTGAQVLESSSTLVSPYNTDLQDCKIIYDETFFLRPQIAGASVQIPWKFKWTPSYDEGHVVWTDSDTTGLVGNMLQGIVRVYIFCDASANYPSTAGYCRTYFVDN